MDKNLLNKYFEQQCSPAERKAVEEWLLNSENKAAFEAFLETRWDQHVEDYSSTVNVKSSHAGRSYWWQAVAAAAVLGIAVYLYDKGTSAPISEHVPETTAVSATDSLSREPSLTAAAMSSSRINPKITEHYERKTNTNKPKTITLKTAAKVNQKDTVKTVKAAKLGNFMVNEVLLTQLRGKIDSNLLILNIDVHDVPFQRFATMLKQRYGIILEPCGKGGQDKTYTARFEKISIPDLLNDMSEKMLFTYSIQDSVVKVCFN